MKVGILDWGFGFEEHEGLYAGGKDFTSYSFHEDNFKHTSEHGFWMAQTLKEIAPDTEVYALGTYVPDSEEEWVDAMIEAVHWAMDEGIDILTLSHQEISDENRQRFDAEIDKAVEQGILSDGGGDRFREPVVSLTLSENGKLLKERLSAIADFRKQPKAVKVLSALLAAALILGGVMTGAAAPADSAVLKGLRGKDAGSRASGGYSDEYG